jgi:DNA polymerase III alpha subunit
MTSVSGDKVFMGFVHVQKLERRFAENFLKERERRGVFIDLEDFIRRVNPVREQMILLIRTGAFAFTGRSKPALLWEAHRLISPKKMKSTEGELFRLKSRRFTLPELNQSLLEDAYDETEFLGFSVSMSAFDMLKTGFRGEVIAAALEYSVGKTVRMVGRLVTIKYVKTVKKEIMNFGTFVDYHGNFFDTVHFPDSLKKYPFQGYGIYLILGKVVEEFGYASVEVEKMARLPVKPDPRA